MFGYQTRAADQPGAPFDARTVRARAPENLPEGSEIYTLDRLHELIPA